MGEWCICRQRVCAKVTALADKHPVECFAAAGSTLTQFAPRGHTALRSLSIHHFGTTVGLFVAVPGGGIDIPGSTFGALIVESAVAAGGGLITPFCCEGTVGGANV